MPPIIRHSRTRSDAPLWVTCTALEQYRRPAVLWTDGKDPTLIRFVVRWFCSEFERPVPPVIFIDHFTHFAKTEAFVEG